MRRIEREPLSPEALELLRRRTQQIVEKGQAYTKIADRVRARKAEVDRLWRQEKAKAFDEIEAALRRMAPGNEYCMYCESGEASDIDHFRPKVKYTTRAYAWENYLWACSVCNSNYKRSEFPTDEHGAPLLINPVEEDPGLHLAFSPSEGKYEPLTPKGEASCRVFGLDRRTLETSRKNAWISVQAHIVAYAAACKEDDARWALHVQRTLCQHPHASLLIELLRIVDLPGAGALVMPIDSRCLAALAAHPEIRSWV